MPPPSLPGNPAVDPTLRLMEDASHNIGLNKGTKTKATMEEREGERRIKEGQIAENRKRVPGMKQDGSLSAGGVPLFSSSQNVSLARSIQMRRKEA